VTENEPRACEAFELDVAATTFNICKRCKLPKADHVNFNRASAELKCKLARRDQINSPTTTKRKGSVCCSNFRRDLSGNSFDTCVCGFPKSAHEVKPLTTGAGEELERKLARTASAQRDDVDDHDGRPSRGGGGDNPCHCACALM